MNDDDELCLCFHVTKRKVIQFIRVRRPKVTSQLSECYGAGTGCGWCRPFLRRLMEAEQPESESIPSAERYAQGRQDYRRTESRSDETPRG